MSVVPAKNGHTANLGVPARVVRASGAWMAIAVSRSTRFVRGEPDERLVAHVRAGEQAAFEAIYDRYSRALLSFCRHMLGDLQEAEDAVQHTFLSAHGALLSDGRDIHLKACCSRSRATAASRCYGPGATTWASRTSSSPRPPPAWPPRWSSARTCARCSTTWRGSPRTSERPCSCPSCERTRTTRSPRCSA